VDAPEERDDVGIQLLGVLKHPQGVGYCGRDGGGRHVVRIDARHFGDDVVVARPEPHGVVKHGLDAGPARAVTQEEKLRRKPPPGHLHDAAVVGRSDKKDLFLLHRVSEA
jgi:hypothetical protein